MESIRIGMDIEVVRFAVLRHCGWGNVFFTSLSPDLGSECISVNTQ